MYTKSAISRFSFSDPRKRTRLPRNLLEPMRLKKANFHDERSRHSAKYSDSAAKGLSLYSECAPMYMTILKEFVLPDELKNRIRQKVSLLELWFLFWELQRIVTNVRAAQGTWQSHNTVYSFTRTNKRISSFTGCWWWLERKKQRLTWCFESGSALYCLFVYLSLLNTFLR